MMRETLDVHINMLSKNTAATLAYIGAFSAFFCALAPLRGLYSGAEPFAAGIVKTIAIVVGGVGFLVRKRAGTAVFSAFLLAMLLWGNGNIFNPARMGDILIITGLVLGLVGIFATQKQTEDTRGQHKKLLDAATAASFARISGATGLSFGTLFWMFSMAEISDFNAFNSSEGILIILLAWQTLKRQTWAAAGQVLLTANLLSRSHNAYGGNLAVFDFFPFFFLLIHALGLVGIMQLKRSRRQEDIRKESHGE